MTCQHCKTDFTPKSNKAKFCCVNCKQANYRVGVAELLKMARMSFSDSFVGKNNKEKSDKMKKGIEEVFITNQPVNDISFLSKIAKAKSKKKTMALIAKKDDITGLPDNHFWEPIVADYKKNKDKPVKVRYVPPVPVSDTIPPMPKREDYKHSIDYGSAKSEWKLKYKQ